MSRPRILDDVKRREIYALVSTGCSLNTAARYVGCSTRTIRRESLRNPEFLDQLHQAEMVCQVGPLRAIRRAAETNWRAAAWLLERGDPEQFARRNPALLTPAQIEEFMEHVIDIISHGIQDKADFQRVALALLKIQRQTTREARDAEQPLRDPRRRRRESIPSLPPPPDPTHDSPPRAA